MLMSIKTEIKRSRLTLRDVLHWASVGAGRAEFVDHSSDVLHLPVHHCLHIVHVEQVEALHLTLQCRDLAPGVAQAGRHPIQLHLGERSGERKWFLCTEYKASGYTEVTSFRHCFYPANFEF